jgi:hypothetical protein|uniref:Uncharacterized protein n=1 Tax=viral metagenome TaxID=1070528 RepID=A0A6C0KJW9_9ZZZZ
MPNQTTLKKFQQAFTIRGNSGLYNYTRNIQAGLQNTMKKMTNRWKMNMNRLTHRHKKSGLTKKTRRTRK